MECPICEYPNARLRYRMRDRFFATSDEEFPMHHCPSCGLFYLEEKSLKNRLGDFYPPGYWWSEEGAGSLLEKKYREWMARADQLQFVLTAFPDPQGKTLLDVGCGGGTFLQEALGAGFDARGLENSPEAAAIADKVAAGRVHLGSESDLVEQGLQFDILTLFHVLEHMPDPFRYLKTLRNLLKPGGTIFVQVPNSASLQAGVFGSRWYGFDCPRHLYNYSAFSVLHLLGRTGYRIHKVRHFSLRDNAAAMVSSLFPSLDPMSQRVKSVRSRGRSRSAGLMVKKLAYLPLMVMAQPLAYMEAKLGRGATISVRATLD